jgi:cyclophilin family peptidyl-prolyl cis-trans isomerase
VTLYNTGRTTSASQEFPVTRTFRTPWIAILLAFAALLPAATIARADPQAANGSKAHPIAVIETAKGVIKIKLYPEEAPKTVDNFVKLANKGFYNGLTFHRVEPGFVIQGGDPKGDGTGGPGYSIPDEKNTKLKHNRGAVAMAKSSAPNSAGSQFYIVINKPAPQLDGGYTVFGQVISGQNVAEKIVKGDKMTKVYIVQPKA